MANATTNLEEPDQLAIDVQKRHFWKRVTTASLWLMIAPVILGVSGAVYGKVRSFSDRSANGGADPAVLSGRISSSLNFTAYALIIAMPAFVILIIALIRRSQLGRQIS